MRFEGTTGPETCECFLEILKTEPFNGSCNCKVRKKRSRGKVGFIYLPEAV
jgi:hypothetical protein